MHPHTLPHAMRIMHHAPCTAHHAPCNMQHAPCPISHHAYHFSSVLCTVVLSCRKVAQTSCAPLGAAISETGTVAETPVVVGAPATPLVLALHREEPHRAPTASHPLLHHTIHHPRTRLFSPAQPIRASRCVCYAWPRTPTTPGNAVPTPSGMAPRPDVTRARREGVTTSNNQTDY